MQPRRERALNTSHAQATASATSWPGRRREGREKGKGRGGGMLQEWQLAVVDDFCLHHTRDRNVPQNPAPCLEIGANLPPVLCKRGVRFAQTGVRASSTSPLGKDWDSCGAWCWIERRGRRRGSGGSGELYLLSKTRKRVQITERFVLNTPVNTHSPPSRPKRQGCTLIAFGRFPSYYLIFCTIGT